MLVLGIIAGAIGLLLIFGREFLWKVQVFNNQLEGQKSERTELWDAGQVISGIVMLLIGVALICVGFGESQAKASEDASATATATTRLSALTGAFGDYLPEWQEAERGTTYSVDTEELGIDARHVYYGRCASNDFFVYVVDFPEQYNNYAYVPEAKPRDCRPDGTFILFDEPIGGGWYTYSHGGSLDDYVTPTPRSAPSATPRATTTPRP